MFSRCLAGRGGGRGFPEKLPAIILLTFGGVWDNIGSVAEHILDMEATANFLL